MHIFSHLNYEVLALLLIAMMEGNAWLAMDTTSLLETHFLPPVNIERMIYVSKHQMGTTIKPKVRICQ